MGRLIDADKAISDYAHYGISHSYDAYDLEDILTECPTVEAIPKDQYEARLKADMIAMLEDLKKEMNPIKECEQYIYGKECWNFVRKCQDVVQQKIDKLREDEL